MEPAAAGRRGGPAGDRGRDQPRDGPGRAQKNDLKPWLKQCWCIPPGEDAAFVAAMEDVLAVAARPPDPTRPVVYLDEGGKALTDHVRPPWPARPAVPGPPEEPALPGVPRREDHEYRRGGAANLFLACAPHLGWRDATVTGRRAAVAFARYVRGLLDGPFRGAERVVLVLDNLNTHTPAAFYKAFDPAEARRLLDKLEWHHTPKHGSWLNVAEIELSVLARQCLARRIPDDIALAREVTAWAERRNAAQVGVDWHFTTADARIKLKHLYPVPLLDNQPLTDHSG